MENFRKIEPAAKEYIDETHLKHWSRAFFSEELPCNINQSNFTESFNRMVIEAHRLPICEMLEWIRRKLRSNMQSRRRKKWNGKVSPKIQKILDERVEKGKGLQLEFAGDDVFEVLGRKPFGEDVRHIVRVDARTCTCRQWQVEGIPCIHAVDSILYKRQKPADFCHYMYSREKYELTYAPILYLLPDKKMWEPLSSVAFNPLWMTRQPGRPRKNRRQDANERMTSTCTHQWLERIKCGKCGGVGHNRRTCTDFNSSQTEGNPPVPPQDHPGVSILQSMGAMSRAKLAFLRGANRSTQ